MSEQNILIQKINFLKKEIRDFDFTKRQSKEYNELKKRLEFAIMLFETLYD